ncbi:MAG TPA: hypothetical protein VFE46_13180 [Pirellulales bacterium]|nr:hypothetical protein [Pirellulales bacterium]
MSTASSSLVKGDGGLLLQWLNAPASNDAPRGTRRVRRSTSADSSGYVHKSSRKPGRCFAVIV